jgi:biopolymer transport protein ExbD
VKSDRPAGRNHRESNTIDLDIVPLMDVIFLLLFFFVIMSVQMVMQKGVPVDLASTDQGATVQERDGPGVSITENGTTHFNDQELPLEELGERITLWRTNNPEKKLLLNVDRSVEHGTVVDVTDRLREAGVTDLMFTVEPAQ